MEFYLSHTEDYKLGSSENSSGWRSWKNSHIHFQDKGSYIKMWCWRRHWRVFWTAGWSNQSLLMEIYPAQSLEGLMLKMKLLYSGHLMGRADSLESPWCWENLRAVGGESDRGWDCWMASSTQWTWVWADSMRWGEDREAWHAAFHGVANSWTWLSHWTATTVNLWNLKPDNKLSASKA